MSIILNIIKPDGSVLKNWCHRAVSGSFLLLCYLILEVNTRINPVNSSETKPSLQWDGE